MLEGKFCLDEPSNITQEEFNIDELTRKKVTSFTPINNCSNIATDKVGLMTFEDYIYSLDGTNGILGALGGSYIDEDELTWTITKYTLDGSTNKSWHIYHKNPAHIEYDYHGTNDYGKAVRPVIYISSKVKIEENNESNYGTIYNPYRLLGEQKLKKGYSLNGVTIGSYIYLSEENNPNNPTIEYITSRLNYSYNKTKVRYRVIGINRDGSIKVQRSDVLRNLPSNISIQSGINIPYYYKENTCDTVTRVYTDCYDQNYFKPNYGSGEFNYIESENLAYYLNNASNSYYNWLSDSVKANILTTNWNLSVGAYGKDYVESLFNFNYTGEYPSRSNDGIASAKIGLPQWGDMFSGNDLNRNYWYINRWPNSYTHLANVDSTGDVYGDASSIAGYAVRPVFYLKSTIKVISGEGTYKDPYVLSI